MRSTFQIQYQHEEGAPFANDSNELLKNMISQIDVFLGRQPESQNNKANELSKKSLLK